jgi:hypothetical protein
MFLAIKRHAAFKAVAGLSGRCAGEAGNAEGENRLPRFRAGLSGWPGLMNGNLMVCH